MKSDVKYMRIDKELRFRELRVRLAFRRASDESTSRLMVDLFEVGDEADTWNVEHGKATVVGFDNMVVKAVQNAYCLERAVNGFCSDPSTLDCMTGELATPNGSAVDRLTPQHVAIAFDSLASCCAVRCDDDWEALGNMFSELSVKMVSFPERCLDLMGLDADGIHAAYARLDCRVVFKKTSKRWSYKPWAQVCAITETARVMTGDKEV